MIKYKLTTQSLTTYNDFQWEVGVKVTTSGEGALCGPGWLHYYHHPLLAVLLNPIHAAINNPKLFKVEARGEHKDGLGLKGGCTEMTLLEELPIPEVSKVQKRAFAILCAKEVYTDNGGVWDTWAEKWLSGEDRSQRSSIKAKISVHAAAYAAADAAYAAYAAAHAAHAANAGRRKSKNKLDLITLAEQAMTYN